jgi:hypothetical protein
MNELATTNTNAEETKALKVFSDNLPADATVLNNASAYEHIWKIANVFSRSGIVPKHYAENVQGTFVALDMARQLNVNPMMMLQSTHSIGGNIGMSAALAISLANTRGPFKGPIRYKTRRLGTVLKIEQKVKTGWDAGNKKPIYKSEFYETENIEVIAWATMAADGEIVESIAVTMEMARLEAWTDNAKYRSMGEYMLRKRAANFLIRETCPEVLMGMQTDEELETIFVPPAAPELAPIVAAQPVQTVQNVQAVQNVETAAPELVVMDKPAKAKRTPAASKEQPRTEVIEAEIVQNVTPAAYVMDDAEEAEIVTENTEAPVLVETAPNLETAQPVQPAAPANWGF